MITNKGRVYFSLRGNDFNPDSLTELIGVAPTNIIYEGTKLKNTTRKFSSWELSTDEICSEVIDVYDLSDEIVKQLISKKDQILDEVQKHNLTPCLQVVLWISTNDEISTPAIGFNPDTLKFISDIGGYIDVDTYRNY